MSQLALENKVSKTSKNNNEQATTTTETVATSSSLTSAKKNTDKDDELILANDNEPDLITSSILVNTQQQSPNGNVFDSSETNKTDNIEPENGKDDNDLMDTPTMPSANPKLIFIERLMDLNFQPPTGLSSFLGSGVADDSNGSDSIDNNKPNKTDDNKFNDKEISKDMDLSWS